MTADLRLVLKWDFVVVGTEIQEWLSFYIEGTDDPAIEGLKEH